MSQHKEAQHKDAVGKVAKVRDMFIPGTVPHVQLSEALDALGYKEPELPTESDPLAQGQGVEL